MPWCPGMHRIKIGQFHAVFIALLEKKTRNAGKSKKYSPFCHWDFCTDLCYRTVVTTVCMLAFLLSTQCVLCAVQIPWITGTMFYSFGGYAGNGYSMCRTYVSGTITSLDSLDSDTLTPFIIHCTTGAISNVQKCCENPSLCHLLILSGDIEQNPGPQIEELIKNLTDRMEERMDSFSDDFKSMSTSVRGMSDRLEQLTEQLKRREKEIREVKEQTDILEKRLRDLEQEVERQQIFSRRDNIIFFGIPEDSVKETHDDCAEKITNLLNKTCQTNKTWSKDDIARAHRLGNSTNQTRPIIIKLQKSRDKHTLITDKLMKAELRKENVSMNDDLTRQQRQTLKEERKNGNIAYFRGAKLISKPATQARSRNIGINDVSDNDTPEEDLPEDRQATTPSPRPHTSRTNDASSKWRQFREQSRQRGRDSSDKQRRSVNDRRDRDSSTERYSTVDNSERQTRSKNTNVTKTKQNRIDHLLSAGSRTNSK